jgi:hypothetical protein
VAARTRLLRVGTSVILLPLHHPVRVAEDVITLDLVSKGRVILGVGIGYQPADFRAFAVAMEDRVALFEESVAMRAKSGAGSSMRIPTTLFSTGRPRALAIASWCSSSFPYVRLLNMTVSSGSRWWAAVYRPLTT